MTATAPSSSYREVEAARLPAEVTARLLADSRRISGHLARRLAEEIVLPPEFSTPRYLRSVVAASRDGVLTLLRRLHRGGRAQAPELSALGVAGARQAELGVPLEVLLSGYRLAAKVVWREVVDEATRLGELSPAAVVGLSEQVLEYLDDISGAVGRSYLETRDRLVRQRDRERDRVLGRLLAGDASEELRRLAATCDLELSPPYRLLALATGATSEADRVLAGAWRQHPGILLAAEEAGAWMALVPADADVRSLWHSAHEEVPDLVVGVGPLAITLEETAAAARLARETLEVGRRLVPGPAAHDHRELAVFAALASEPVRLVDFARHVLGPLTDGTSRYRGLLATLETVLKTRSIGEAATQLGLHRHTVVYRLERIRTLLGTDLDDPSERHRLWLAVTALRLAATSR